MSIYFDNQATTPLSEAVIQAMQPFVNGELFANPHSTEHLLGVQSARTIDTHRESISECLACNPSEIIFTSGATEANNHAIIGTALKNLSTNSHKKRVLLSAVEHKCVIGACRFVRDTFGIILEFIPVLPSGIIDMLYLKNTLSDDVLQVCVMATNNEIGTNQPVAEISELCVEVGASLHIDAVQGIYAGLPHIVACATTLSLSSHKMYGPKGIGCLFINEFAETTIPRPLIYGGGQENGHRSGTLSPALVVGFATAMQEILNTTTAHTDHLKTLSAQFIKELKTSGIKFKINGCTQNRHPGNLNMQFLDIEANRLLPKISDKICISSGSACTSGIQEPSHVLKSIGLTTQQCDHSVRISFGQFNTPAEITYTVQKISEVIQKS